MAEVPTIQAERAFRREWKPGTPGDPGVIVRERADLSLATLVALDRPPLERAILTRWRCALPRGPKSAHTPELSFLGVGPRTWLAVSATPDMPAELAASAGPHGAVADQSHGYVVIELSGARVMSVLEKGVPIDLHQSVFAVGDAASTLCAQIGVIIWRLDRRPGFGMALFRSYARSFQDWLEDSAAEFGLRVDSGAGRD